MTPAARTCAACRYAWLNVYQLGKDEHGRTHWHSECCVDPPNGTPARIKSERPACHRYEPTPTAPARAETDDELR